MALLNEEQSVIADLACKGHNLFIDGKAGTGKSFLLKQIFSSLSSLKTVAITCTTGIACMNYESVMGACTIHRWSGVNDGRYSSSEVLHIVQNNEAIMNRIKSTDVLIIDEISMLSSKLFNQIHDICSLRDPNQPWGGIQLIVAGDFHQLSSVPNRAYNDDGEFCFKSSLFTSLHHVRLTKVVRQSDSKFIDLINTVSTGQAMNNEQYELIKSLERPLPPTLGRTVKLYAKTDLVRSYNRAQILKDKGTIVQYKSVDSGDITKLDNVTAGQILWLQENCPVVLIRNLSDKLVNGLQGTVTKCDPDGPTVYFPTQNVTVKVNRISFSVFSPRENKTLANREQFPLLLSYALTIHKAQGMTLDRVEVDCRDIFTPGQLGVAISRVRSIHGLRVINFDRKVRLPQPAEVIHLTEEPSLPVDEDLSCCRLTKRKVVDEDIPEEFWIEDVEGGFDYELEPEPEFDEQFNEIIARIDLEESLLNVQIPDNYNITEVLKECEKDLSVSPANNIIKQMLDNDMDTVNIFCKKQFQELSKIVEDIGVKENSGVKAEKLNRFYETCHKYQTSDNYRQSCDLLFENYQPVTSAHSYTCTYITKSIREHLLKVKAKIHEVSDREVSSRSLTDASKARIRYVGGYCISSVKKKYTSMNKNHMYSVSSHGQVLFQESEERINILNKFTEREEILKETTNYPESLLDVNRLQYASHGLINITDNMHIFFL